LVTGANRGLGLGFVEKILAGSDDLPFLPADVIVVATARDPTKATALHELKEKYGDRLVICTLDQTIPASLTEFLVELDNAKVTHIDLLILNAGTVEPNPAASIADLDRAEALHILHTNSLAPILLANALIPRLNAAQTARGGEVETVEMDKNAGSDGPKDPKDVKLEHTKGMHRPKKVDRPTHVRVVFVSSSMGSIGACCNSNAPSYRASKAALNMYIRCFAFQYPHLAVMPLHPGWVQTGTSIALLSSTLIISYFLSFSYLTCSSSPQTWASAASVRPPPRWTTASPAASAKSRTRAWARAASAWRASMTPPGCGNAPSMHCLGINT
jgi:NAD(P)-dependent dehydrogenase (short-subunit alcohol dehydrogenase family)